jgi:membrane associated rhomboid family serine protease
MFIPIHDQNPMRNIHFAFVTYGLMAVTILIFVYQMTLSSAAFDTLTIDYGMIPIVVRNAYPAPLPWLPDWANLFTYAFLHVSWLHLLSNMLFLWIFGDNIEDAMGHVRFLAFYFICAAAAGLLHLAFNLDGNGPLIGASGAVAGVMGAYMMLYPHARLIVLLGMTVPVPLPIPALWMLVFWVGTQVFYVLIGSEEPVAWWAHLGGIAAGVILAPLLKRRSVPLFGGRIPRR